MGKTLLIITTYNKSDYTRMCLESVKKIEDDVDVLIIDDVSTDDTVEVCKSFGYEVIEKPEGRGLTHSWNIGYDEFMKRKQYDYFILAGHDMLVPNGAITEMVNVIERWPFNVVVPTSTTRGVGHNPIQSVVNHYNGFEPECNEPENYQNIQDNMLAIKKDLKTKKDLYLLDPFRMKHFNGFFFMMNRNISKHKFSDEDFFDPKFIMSKNEDEFNWKKLLPADDHPALCKTAFIFHYKGLTSNGALSNNATWEEARFGKK